MESGNRWAMVFAGKPSQYRMTQDGPAHRSSQKISLGISWQEQGMPMKAARHHDSNVSEAHDSNLLE